MMNKKQTEKNKEVKGVRFFDETNHISNKGIKELEQMRRRLKKGSYYN